MQPTNTIRLRGTFLKENLNEEKFTKELLDIMCCMVSEQQELFTTMLVRAVADYTKKPSILTKIKNMVVKPKVVVVSDDDCEYGYNPTYFLAKAKHLLASNLPENFEGKVHLELGKRSEFQKELFLIDLEESVKHYADIAVLKSKSKRYEK